MEITASVEALHREQSFIAAAPGGTGEVRKSTKTILNIQATVPLPGGSIITIEFPKVNPEAAESQQSSYFADPTTNEVRRPLCTAIKNAAAPTCTLEQNLQNEEEKKVDKLTITGALPNGLGRGSTVRIQIDSLLNPLSLNARTFFTALAVVSERDGRVYHIEDGLTAFRATEPTTISQIEISATTTTV